MKKNSLSSRGSFRWLGVVCGFLLAGEALGAVAAAAGHWDGRFGTFSNLRGVFGCVELDSSGALLYGGNATVTTAPGGNFHRWDGVRWQALPMASNPPDFIFDRGSRIYCGTTAAGAGTTPRTWFIENGAVRTMGADLNQKVNAMILAGDEIIAGGNFSASGTTAAHRVARWDGSAWQAMGAGLPGGTAANNVTALAYDGVNVYAAWNSPSGMALMRWNGAEWSQIGLFSAGAAAANIRALCWSEGALYVGGSFTSVNEIPARSLAVWRDNAWSQWGPGKVGGQVEGIVAHAGRYFVSGDLSHPSQAANCALIEVSGDTFAPRLAGIAVRGGKVKALQNEIFLQAFGGSDAQASMFTTMAATFRYRSEQDWSKLGALGNLPPPIFAPNNFHEIVPSPHGPVISMFDDGQTLPTPGPVIWNGARFVITRPAPRDALVQLHTELTYSGNAVYCRGVANGLSAIFILRDGLWEQFTAPLPSAPVAIAANGRELIAAVGSTVLAWNGTGWLQLGGSIGTITKVAHFKGQWHVAGTLSGLRGLGRWNGAAWESLPGESLGRSAAAGVTKGMALHVSGDKLYVGGLFDSAGGVAATNLAAWNGASWEAIPGFYNDAGGVSDIARSPDGLLAVAGEFGRIDNGSVVGLAILDGGQWQTPPYMVYTGRHSVRLLWHGRDLLMTGRFDVRSSIPSYGFAIWHHDQPLLLNLPSGDSRTLKLQATGATPGRYSLQSSADLRGWTPVGENNLGESTTVTLPIEDGARFFRTAGN